MYTIPKDYKITAQLLNDVIQYNEMRKARFEKLEEYYIGKQAILERIKNDRLKNNKIMVNHAKYITDITTGFFMGNPVDYKVLEGKDIKPLLDAYKKQSINRLDVEIAKCMSIFGLQREYVYADEKSEPKSCILDNKNSIIVYDDTVEHNKMFGMIYRPIYKGTQFQYYDVIVGTSTDIIRYRCTDKRIRREGESKPHGFGKVPFIEYKNNPEHLGDFEPIISLADAYNILQSDRLNDKEQLVDAILCMYGVDFEEEERKQLEESRMLAGIPTDARIEYLVKSFQESEIDVLRKNIENDIHKISMVPNMADENFAGNSSGVAIQYKLIAFEQMVKAKESYMEQGLKERFELYNHFLSTNAKMDTVPPEDVEIVFTHSLPRNDYEISQMVNNLSDLVDAETLIGQLSFIKDASEIIKRKKKEDKETIEGFPNNEYTPNEIEDLNEDTEKEE